MPRKPRQKSALNIYHVILRGINKQIIFEDKADYLQFVNILMFYKEECNFKLFAYCLMDNHIHLLVEESDVSLDEIMKRIEVKFVRWYNKKYERIGYLFQDRYKSEPVNDEKYFLTVFVCTIYFTDRQGFFSERIELKQKQACTYKSKADGLKKRNRFPQKENAQQGCKKYPG